MRNVHSRVIPLAAVPLGALVETLGGPDDVVWPSRDWPPMRLDAGLEPGSAGGHGPIGYVVTDHEPGVRTRFRFTAPRGLDGWHEFTLEPVDDDATRVTHVIEARMSGPMLIVWPVAIRWLHDALLEDLLDGLDPAGPRSRWSLWVRVLRARARRGAAARPPRS